MSQSRAATTLSHVNADVRDLLLDWVVEFDQHWQVGLLESHLETLPPHLQPWRAVAVAELVKIDMAKQWKSGSKVLLEKYLKSFPELGTSKTVSPELILAEFEARKLAGDRFSRRELNTRFPKQSRAVQEAVSASSVISKNGLSASPSSRTAGPAVAGDTASLSPGETFSNEQSFGAVPRPGTLAAGSLFGENGRYQIVKSLGGGGMGAVYLAKDSSLGDRKVAIKVPHFAAGEDPEMLERFRREAALLATVKHANLGDIYDVNEFEGVHYLVMEFISETSLAGYIETRKILPANCVRLVRKVALALQATHDKGIVHRDLKPDNIMLAQGGQPKVIDFGLAVDVESGGMRATQNGMTMGTPEYMPLEQVTGNLSTIGPRSDIYSLGVMLYKLLTGTVPFTGTSPLAVGVKILNEVAPSPCEHCPDLDPRLADIVLKAIAKEPSDRYASMDEFAQTLLDYTKSSGDSAPPSVIAPPLQPAEQIEASDSVAAPTVTSEAMSPTESLPVFEPAEFETAESVGMDEVTVPTFAPTSIAAAQRKRSRRPTAVWTGVVFVSLAFGLILYFRSGDTLIKVDVKSPDVTVTFHDNRITLADGTQQFHVEPGKHRLHVKVESADLETQTFTIKKGETATVTVELVNAQLIARLGNRTVLRLPFSKTDDRASEEEAGTELLKNGSGEWLDADSQFKDWKTVRGRWKVAPPNVTPHDGRNAFYGNIGRREAELIQDVDLEEFREQFADRTLELTFSGYLSTWNTPDRSRIVVEYRNHDNSKVLESYDTGFRLSQHHWTHFTDTRIPNPEVHWARVRLITTRHFANKNDAAFDSLSFKVVKRKNFTTERIAPAPGQWIDLLEKVRLPDHAIFGKWKRVDGTLVSDGAPVATVMTPVVLRGSYELRCEFTRWSGADACSWSLPVGDRGVTLFVSRGAGTAHGLSSVGRRDTPQLSTDSGAVTKPGTLENAIRHQLHAQVNLNGAKAHIKATLDEETIVSWSGSIDDLIPYSDRVLPVPYAIGIASSAKCVAHYHSLELKTNHDTLIYQLGDDWAVPFALPNLEPPASIADKCVSWNGRSYYFSEKPMTMTQAQILARQYRGRLLTISSLEEDDFIQSQRKGSELWMAGWRRAGSNQWRDERNRPLRFYRWSPGQPDNWFGGTETLLHTGYNNNHWNDMKRSHGGSYACIEWGQEYDDERPGDATSGKSESRTPPEIPNGNAPETDGSSASLQNALDRVVASTIESRPGNVSETRKPVAHDITNGDFSDGLNGWNLEGGASNFRVFDSRSHKSLTTFGKNKDRDTGRMWQSFVVPDDAVALRWFVHGYRGPTVRVALLLEGRIHVQADAPRANNPVKVQWDLKSLRGKPVVLEIVDKTTRGYIGAHGFQILREETDL